MRARSMVLFVLTVELGVLIVTGVLLFFFYIPQASGSWSDVGVASRDSGVALSNALRFTHRAGSRLFVTTAVAAAILVMLTSRSRRERWRGGGIGIGLAVGAIAASFTGFLLPWDQLALWAVTVGTNMRGFRPLFDDQVRFVLISSAEVGRDTIARWLIVHAVLGGVLAVLIPLGWRHAIGGREQVR